VNAQGDYDDARYGVAFDLRRCDAANDCAEGQRCCESWNNVMGDGQAFTTRCAAPTPGKCGDYEACVVDADCPADASCVKRRCQRVRRELQCGSQICRGDDALCCERGGSLECGTKRSNCPGHLACTRPSDCPGILRCARGSMGSECKGKFYSHMHDTIACASDADCQDGFVPRRPRCLDGWCAPKR